MSQRPAAASPRAAPARPGGARRGRRKNFHTMMRRSEPGRVAGEEPLKYLALALLHLGALPPRQPGACWFRGPGLAAVLRVWVLALLDPRQSKVQVRRVLRVASDPFPRARGKELGCRPRSRGPLLQSARRTH